MTVFKITVLLLGVEMVVSLNPTLKFNTCSTCIDGDTKGISVEDHTSQVSWEGFISGISITFKMTKRGRYDSNFLILITVILIGSLSHYLIV